MKWFVWSDNGMLLWVFRVCFVTMIMVDTIKNSMVVKISAGSSFLGHNWVKNDVKKRVYRNGWKV